jgi:predicted P-loop ATPase
VNHRERGDGERGGHEGGGRGHHDERGCGGRPEDERQGRQGQIADLSQPTDDAATIKREASWTDGLIVNRHGQPLGNLRNVLHALRNAPEWQSVLAYDEFAEEVITRNATPWGSAAAEKWTDDDDNRTCEWMQDEGILAAHGIVGRAVQTVARENRVHPVRDFLKTLKWDGTPRLDAWLTRYLGVEDTPYARAVGSCFLISAVARIFVPGCQADHMLILEGPQGLLKSSALRVLADPWFTDSLSRVGTKDAAMEIAGAWLIEMSELDAMTRAGNSAIKSFVTRRVDRFRLPYGRRVIQRRRQCVFAGTINPAGNYLKDPTGARRFWPVECGAIDRDSLAQDRDQLWAEAVARFRGGAPWWLDTPELVALATAEQDLRFPRDPWADHVAEWLIGRDDVSVGEVLTSALGIAAANQSHSAEIRIAIILKANGFEQYRPGKAGQPRTPRYRRVVPVENAAGTRGIA